MKLRTIMVAALALLVSGAAFSESPPAVSPYTYIGSSHCRVINASLGLDLDSNDTKYRITTVKGTIFATCRYDSEVSFEDLISFSVPFAPMYDFQSGSYCKVQVGTKKYAGEGFVGINKLGFVSSTCIASTANEMPF
jgi:hypothetical protein